MTRCKRPWTRGWRCYLADGHWGPCPLWPTWWKRLTDPRTRHMVRR